MTREHDPTTHVEIRHHGRRYAADVCLNGSTTITRDGLYLLRADWNGRALDPGDNEVHPDLDTSNAILEALARAIKETAAAVPRTRPGPDAYPV